MASSVNLATLLLLLFSAVMPAFSDLQVEAQEDLPVLPELHIRSRTMSPGGGNLQLNHIMDALVRSGDFAVWSHLLRSVGPLTLPITATIFAPIDAALLGRPPLGIIPGRSSLESLSYHVSPLRLTYSDLQLLAVGTRLPTLFSGRSILVTGNGPWNLTLDECAVSHPDLVTNGAIVVHGVSCVLDFSKYGLEEVVGDSGMAGSSSTGIDASSWMDDESTASAASTSGPEQVTNDSHNDQAGECTVPPVAEVEHGEQIEYVQLGPTASSASAGRSSSLPGRLPRPIITFS